MRARQSNLFTANKHTARKNRAKCAILLGMTDIIISFFKTVGEVLALALFTFFVLIGATEPAYVSYAPPPISAPYESPSENADDAQADAMDSATAEVAEQKKQATIPDTALPADAADLAERVKKTLSSFVPSVTSAPDTDELNDQARAALVNILCVQGTGSLLGSITGSGIIIDPRGIIITNAHIGEYFLFEHYPEKDALDCVIRTGAPATIAYDAELLYISPQWVRDNAHTINDENPEGTGENDFALLRITSSRTQIPLPSQFPFIAPDTSDETLVKDAPVLLASYPAGFLGGIIIQKELWPASAVSSITQLFTFKTGSIDLISVGGSIIAQKGSSGSGVIDIGTGKMVALVSTTSAGDTTDARDLNAITLAHINRSISADLSIDLQTFLAGNPATQAILFSQTLFPTLREFLLQELKK